MLRFTIIQITLPDLLIYTSLRGADVGVYALVDNSDGRLLTVDRNKSILEEIVEEFSRSGL